MDRFFNILFFYLILIFFDLIFIIIFMPIIIDSDLEFFNY